MLCIFYCVSVELKLLFVSILCWLCPQTPTGALPLDLPGDYHPQTPFLSPVAHYWLRPWPDDLLELFSHCVSCFTVSLQCQWHVCFNAVHIMFSIRVQSACIVLLSFVWIVYCRFVSFDSRLYVYRHAECTDSGIMLSCTLVILCIIVCLSRNLAKSSYCCLW